MEKYQEVIQSKYQTYMVARVVVKPLNLDQLKDLQIHGITSSHMYIESSITSYMVSRS